MGRRARFVLLVILWATSTTAWSFDYRTVVDKARLLAQQPYEAPRPIPKFMQEMSFHQYQGIRFKPEKSLWREAQSRFQVMLVPPGLYYTHAVKINVIDSGGVRPLAYSKDYFNFELGDAGETEKKIPPDIGFAGFKLTYPFKGKDAQNQFLVFAGASYFRGVGADNAFGLSARGLAIDTGLPSGEQFPSFIEFWLERPNAAAKSMTVYGLLSGESVTGAYRFVITPGAVTKMAVQATLFTRKEVRLLGVAPLTSMFFYGENTPRPRGEWRPRVHDSDGLLVHDGATGEWLWRPLINPKRLQMDYFMVGAVRGFGLMQRQGRFDAYEDYSTRYELRPSGWIEPQGEWGKGNVVLVQLPTPNETNDNIVAFWSPAERVPPGKPLSLAYTLSFGGPAVVNTPMAQAQDTYLGSGNLIGGGHVPGSYRFIVDFAGGPLAAHDPKTPVTGVVTALEEGQIIESFVEYLEPDSQWRLSILAKPAANRPLALRAFLKEGDKTLSETWTYYLPALDAAEIEGQ